MRRPHGEPPGRQPAADQQQLLSPLCLPAPSSQTEAKPGQHTEAKPGRRIIFAFSALRPGFAGIPAPAAEPPSSDVGGALGPSASDPSRHSQVGRPALGTRLWAERPLYDRSIRTGCGFCTAPRYQGGMTDFSSRTERRAPAALIRGRADMDRPGCWVHCPAAGGRALRPGGARLLVLRLLAGLCPVRGRHRPLLGAQPKNE